MTAPLTVDLAIVGSGFGGSLLAMIARRLGLSVALLERGSHPRFAIGESASPLAGVVLEQLAARYDLPQLTPLASYGRWMRHYPQLTCGLKRGFTFYKHDEHRRFARRSDRANELLVAASPDTDRSDTHWLRADVDAFLAHEAVLLGAEYIDQLTLDRVQWRAEGPLLSGTRRGSLVRVAASLVVDASGPRGFLSRALDLPTSEFRGYPATQALYSHFTGVARCADLPEFATSEHPPYPIDAAALHHVFDQGWMWVLRFDSGVTSAGVAVTDQLAAELRLADGERAWHRLLQRYPTIQAQFAEAATIRAFTWMPRVSWRTTCAAGAGWAMLPSAAAFVDPLFSTGIPLTLLGVERMAARLAAATAGAALPAGAAPCAPALLAGGSEVALDRDFEGRTLREADHVARFVAGCYAAFPCFDTFTAWSMFYFAAASFSEMSRRIHGDRWSRGFLLADDSRFAGTMEALSPDNGIARAAGAPDGGRFPCLTRVAEAIAPINIAGLADSAKRNWYGVDAGETAAAADKLGATADQVRTLFAGTP